MIYMQLQECTDPTTDTQFYRLTAGDHEKHVQMVIRVDCNKEDLIKALHGMVRKLGASND